MQAPMWTAASASPLLLYAMQLLLLLAALAAAAAAPVAYDPWYFATPTAFDQWTSRYDVGLTPFAAADGMLYAVGGVVRPTVPTGQAQTLSLAGDSWRSADGINWMPLGAVAFANRTAVWPNGRAGVAVLPIGGAADGTVIAFGGYDALTSDGSEPVLQGGTWVRDRSTNAWTEVPSQWFTTGSTRPTAIAYAVSGTEQIIWLYAGRGVDDLWRYATASGWEQVSARAVNGATTLGFSTGVRGVVLNSGTGFSSPVFALVGGSGDNALAWALNTTLTNTTTNDNAVSAIWMPATIVGAIAWAADALVLPENSAQTSTVYALSQSASISGVTQLELSYAVASSQWQLSRGSTYDTAARADTAVAQFRDVIVSVGGSADTGPTGLKGQRWDVVLGYLVTSGACGTNAGNARCHYPGAFCVLATGNSTLSTCVTANFCSAHTDACANGGTCMSVLQPNSTTTYTCACTSDFTGATCSDGVETRSELERWARMLPTWVALPIGAALFIALVVVSAVLCAKTCECCKRAKDRKTDSAKDKDPNSQPDAAPHGGTTQAPGDRVPSRSASDSTASNSASQSGISIGGGGGGSNSALGYVPAAAAATGDGGLPAQYAGDLARLPPHTAMLIRAEPQATVPLRYSAIEMDQLKAQVSRRFDVLFAERQASMLRVYDTAETRFKTLCGNKPPPPSLLGLSISPVAMPAAAAARPAP